MRTKLHTIGSAIVTGTAAFAAVSTAVASQAKVGDAHGAMNWFDFGAWWSEGASPPFIAVLINFSILCWLVFKILKPGLSRRFSDRRDTVQKALDDAERLQTSAKKAMVEVVARSEALEQEMSALRDMVLGGGRAEAARIVKEAEERTERMRKDSELVMAQEMSSLLAELRAELVEKVITAAEAILREKLGPEDQDRLTQEYLEVVSPSPRVSRPPVART